VSIYYFITSPPHEFLTKNAPTFFKNVPTFFFFNISSYFQLFTQCCNLFAISIFYFFNIFRYVPTFFRNVGFDKYFLSTFCKMLQHYFLKKAHRPVAREAAGRSTASAQGRGGRRRRREELAWPEAVVHGSSDHSHSGAQEGGGFGWRTQAGARGEGGRGRRRPHTGGGREWGCDLGLLLLLLGHSWASGGLYLC
jgi:hypothetical protein